MKWTASPLIRPLTFLLPMLLSLRADNVRKCYVCTEKSSPKCAGKLSPSDTELIKECSTGIDGKEIAKGCQVFWKQTREFDPYRIVIWRDCLYGIDLQTHGWSIDDGGMNHILEQGSRGSQYEVSSNVPKINEKRGPFQIPPMPSYDGSVPQGDNFLWFWYHERQLNLSNEDSLGDLFDDYRKPPKPRSVKCFVCTDDDEGCKDKLTSSNTEFIKDCVGSPDTTVPVGCQTLVGQYDYPEKTYLYRDCLYEHYIKCHLKNYKKVGDGYVFRLREWITCLNSVRSYLGLTSHSTDRLPDEESRPMTVLSYKPRENARGQGQVIKRRNQPDLSNGEAIEDLIKQPTPPDFKIDGPFNCFICDTRQVLADAHDCDYAPNSKRSLPSQQCKSPSDDSYGCLMLYEEDPDTGKTKWARRECWYNGDLYCLKGLLKPPSGRSNVDCPKPGRNCKARALIQEGKQVFWNGKREFWNSEDYDEFRNCVRNIRQQQNTKDTLPELPEFVYHPNYKPKVLQYSFCAGEGECNGKGSPNFVPLPRPTHPPTTKQPNNNSSGGNGGDECQPQDDFEDETCEWENGNNSDGWLVWALLIGGLIVIGCAIGGWMWWRNNQRQRNQVANQSESQRPL